MKKTFVFVQKNAESRAFLYLKKKKKPLVCFRSVARMKAHRLMSVLVKRGLEQVSKKQSGKYTITQTSHRLKGFLVINGMWESDAERYTCVCTRMITPWDRQVKNVCVLSSCSLQGMSRSERIKAPRCWLMSAYRRLTAAPVAQSCSCRSDTRLPSHRYLSLSLSRRLSIALSIPS